MTFGLIRRCIPFHSIPSLEEMGVRGRVIAARRHLSLARPPSERAVSTGQPAGALNHARARRLTLPQPPARRVLADAGGSCVLFSHACPVGDDGPVPMVATAGVCVCVCVCVSKRTVQRCRCSTCATRRSRHCVMIVAMCRPLVSRPSYTGSCLEMTCHMRILSLNH